MAKHIKGSIDPTALSFTDEPYRGRIRQDTSKYAEIFSQAKPNKRLRCPRGTAARIASQFKKWLEKSGTKEPVVRSVENYGDGFGGVWWIKEAEKPRTVWAGIGDIGKKAA